VLTAVLLTFVAVAGPWAVHLAPREQRLIALVGLVGVLILWLLFENWAGKWYFWVGLIVGLVSIPFVGGGQKGGGGPSRRPRPRAEADLTEEF